MEKTEEKLDFEELRPNFLPQQAMLEANRCLYCYDAPCRKGCPVNIDIPHFIQSIRSGNLKRSARLINDANPFGSVCGRVCPVERLCEEKCVLSEIGKPVEIGMLQRFAMDYGEYLRQPAAKNGRKVAVIGSGPAGLSCASELARNGYEVTVFESKQVPGGMVAYGVPEYRCPHSVTAAEVEKIVNEGVEIRSATPVNRDVSELFELGYEAVFVGVGLTKTSRFTVPGMELKGVYMGLDFLNRISAGDRPDVGRKTVTIGGGDTALDCARSALRLGAEESTIVYRRSFVELPADKREIEEALEEGVVFRTLAQPMAFYGDDQGVLRAVECANVKLGKPDESGRRSPVIIKGSEFRFAANTVIFATGTQPSGLLRRILVAAEYVDNRFLKVNPETMETSITGVFAGGDVVNKGQTVVQAVAEGKLAARGMLKYLETKAEPVPMEEVVPAEAPDVEEVELEVEEVEETPMKEQKLEHIEDKVEEALEQARETLKKLEEEEKEISEEVVHKVETTEEEAIIEEEVEEPEEETESAEAAPEKAEELEVEELEVEELEAEEPEVKELEVEELEAEEPEVKELEVEKLMEEELVEEELLPEEPEAEEPEEVLEEAVEAVQQDTDELIGKIEADEKTVEEALEEIIESKEEEPSEEEPSGEEPVEKAEEEETQEETSEEEKPGDIGEKGGHHGN